MPHKARMYRACTKKLAWTKMSVLANEIGMILLLRVSGGFRLAPTNISGDYIPVVGGSYHRKTAMKGACMAFRNEKGGLPDENPLVV